MALKERLKELLETDDEILNMGGGFLTAGRWDRPRYDFVGLILKVSGYSLQSGPCCGNPECTTGAKLPLNAPFLDRKWMEYEKRLGLTLEQFQEIPALARQLWEAEYGEEEAKALPFYSDQVEGEPAWFWDHLEEVQGYHLIGFLDGEYPDCINEACDAEE